MKNYNNFILEDYNYNPNYVQNISEEECIELFKTTTLYKTLMNSVDKTIPEENLIYRMITESYAGKPNSYVDYNVVDPKTITRISPYAFNNLYNLMFSNLPIWSKYPKRENSLICADSIAIYERGSKTYYGKRHYIVIPLGKNPKIGVCPDDDIFSSFKTINGYIEDFFENLQYAYKLVCGNKINEHEWNILTKQLEEYDRLRESDAGLDYNLTLLQTIDDHNYDFAIKSWLNKDISTIEFIEMLFNPVSNDFELLNYDGTQHLHDCEIWTDAKSLLIHYDEIDNFLKNF
jgi:hypothetical protein